MATFNGTDLAVPPRPARFNTKNGRRKTGVLIVGQASTGKRTLSRALVEESNNRRPDDLEPVILTRESLLRPNPATSAADIDFVVLLVDSTSPTALSWFAHELETVERTGNGWFLGRIAVCLTRRELLVNLTLGLVAEDDGTDGACGIVDDAGQRVVSLVDVKTALEDLDPSIPLFATSPTTLPDVAKRLTRLIGVSCQGTEQINGSATMLVAPTSRVEVEAAVGGEAMVGVGSAGV